MTKTINSTFERFLLLYLTLYIIPYGFEYIVELELNPNSPSFWTPLTTWFGETFMGWEFDMNRLMKGFDSKYDYSRFSLIFVISILGAVIWRFLDRKITFLKINVRTWIVTIVRYHVGLTLILYGMSKVFMLQFGEMDLLNLEDEIGTYTGMGFLWKFMSYSAFYTTITGYVEVVGGILLLFRKTTFLGALISFVAMVNVVIIDIGYDVSVKMFAIHLLLMVVILISYDLKKIIRFVVFNKAVEGVTYPPLFSPKHAKIKHVLKGILLCYFTISQFYFFSERMEREKGENLYPSLTKIFQVEKQLINGKESDSHELPEANKWKKITINGSSRLNNTMIVETNTGRPIYFSIEADTIQKTITFHPFRGDKKETHMFTYEKLSSKEYQFNGVYKGDTLSITTKTKSKEDFRLMRDKFKWIRDLK